MSGGISNNSDTKQFGLVDHWPRKAGGKEFPRRAGKYRSNRG